MKRTIALLAVIAMLVSFVSIPVSAITTAPTEAITLPEVGRFSLPADVEVAGTPEEDLNAALNVPGGTIEFVTDVMPEYGLYAWVAEDGYAKSTNQGAVPSPGGSEVTQSIVVAMVDIGSEQGISFDVKVSCQDEENTDCVGFFADNTLVKTWYGEVDWETFTFALPAGKHTLIWIYEKDGSVDGGADTGYLDNIEVIPFQHYNPVHSEELDAALNVSGGELEFYTPEEATNGYFPWVAEDGYAKSTNQGVDSTVDRAPPSISTVKTSVDANEGDVLTFRYKVSSEKKMDRLRFYVDGVRMKQWSGDLDWDVYFFELEPGEHVLQWQYDKDYSSSQFEDTAYLDDVYVGVPEHATGVEIQETASVAGLRQTQLVWNVLPDTAFNRNVSFTSSDESVVTVDEHGVITGVTQGQAVITVTTDDGGFTDTCLVNVTADVPAVNIYGFIYAQFADNVEGYYRNAKTWCNFTDTDPENATIIGTMPGTADITAGRIVRCAALVGDTVYGYTSGGYFFTLDFEAMQRGELDVQYKRANVTGTEGFYPTEMAYDYSTDTMYIINDLEVLYEVDLETGDLVLDSYRFLEGELPGARPGAANAVCGFAIDMEGNAYVMVVGHGMFWGGTGGSRLASLDLATGEYTVIGQTTSEAYHEQSMCFDYNTGRLYWAQFNTIYNWDNVQLYIVDTETAELQDCGRVTEFGSEILGMFIPICDHTSDIKVVEAKAPTCMASGNIAYWQCRDCGKCFCDENLVEAIPIEEVTLPVVEHQTEVKGAKEATCTEAGYTGDEVCIFCGETVKQGEVIPANCPSKAFADLNTSCWYHEYTDYVIAQGLMNGVGGNRFAPDASLTRGQLVTTLYRLAGEPEVTEPATFLDVEEGQYYADAVAWAETLGIVKGVTATAFQPEGAVSRQQAATFLYRYVTLYLEQEPVQGADLKAYTDGGTVQNYAKDAMAWAVAEGFFEGYGDQTLRPAVALTRSQMAKLLTILDQNF